jgi:hypothetical protein
MRVRSLPPALFVISAATASLAAPATLEGAKQIEDGYAAYFGRVVVDAHVVAVAPSGESYLVTWKPQNALDVAGVARDALRVGPFSYTLTPGDGDSWTVKADAFPSVAFNVPTTDKGQTTGAVEFGGFRLETTYDGAQKDFLRSLVAVDLLSVRLHGVEPANAADFVLTESGISVDTRAKAADGGDGVDVAIAQSAQSFSETIVTPALNGQGTPATMRYDLGGMTGAATVTGLRAREIGDFWKFFIAHVDDAEAPPDWKQRLGATLPLWRDLEASAEARDMTLQSPSGEATMKTLGEKLGLSGLVADGAAEIGINLDQLAVKSPLLPPWAAALSPASLNFDLRVADKGLDQAARLALDDPKFGHEGGLSPETEAKIGALFLAGQPKLTLAPGRLTTPTLDLTFEGEASADAGAPSGRFTFTADGLDKTIALLAEIAKSEPDLSSAAIGATYLKGLAATGPDGRLVWKVEASEAGLVVNGTQLAPGK